MRSPGCANQRGTLIYCIIVWTCRCLTPVRHLQRTIKYRRNIEKAGHAHTLGIVLHRTSRITDLGRNQWGTFSESRTVKGKLSWSSWIDSDTLCSLTSSIIPSSAPRSRSPWLQQFRWFLGRSFLRSIGLRSRAIVSSRAIVLTWEMAVRRPRGPMDVAGNCLLKDEKPKGTFPNGDKVCLGFSHDHARGCPVS